ncbi:MAG: iron-sulfur cluster assembly accessory protein [bacterium]|jgi:iron-sulfur cluster assembly protein
MDNIKDLPSVVLDTEIIGAKERDNIVITERALAEIKRIYVEKSVPAEYLLRIDIESGGCSGVHHILGFDNEISENDKVFDTDGLGIVIDRKALFVLQSTTIDYINDINGSGFIFDNPYVSTGCSGCSN